MADVLAARALGVSPLVFLRAISGVFQAAAGMCLVTLAVRVALVDAGTDQALRLVVCLAVATVVYLALCAWRVPELTREVRQLLRSRSRGSQRMAVPAAPAES